MTFDMTKGAPLRLILVFTLPLLLGNLFQQMYNLVDAVIVGKFLGLNALSSVNASASVLFLVINFVIGVCCGFAIPVAQRFGAGDERSMRRYVANAALLSAALAAVLTVATTLLCRLILQWLSTPEAIYAGAYQYLLIIFLGIPCTVLYNMSASILRALGDSRTPFLFLVVSTVVNVVLDLLFIVALGLGVSGAALATVIGQGMSGVLCLRFLVRRFAILKLQPGEEKPSLACMGTLLCSGLPMGLQYSITAIGLMMLQSAVNLLGSTPVAAYAVVSKVQQLFLCPFDALGTAMATYCGQNIGALQYQRIYQGLKQSILVGFVYAALAALILCTLGGRIGTVLFGLTDWTVIAYVRRFLICTSLFYWLLSPLNTIRYSIQGVGFSALAVLAGVFELIGRGVVSQMITPRVGFTGVCFTDPTAWVAACLFLGPAFFWVMHHLQRNIAEQENPAERADQG